MSPCHGSSRAIQEEKSQRALPDMSRSTDQPTSVHLARLLDRTDGGCVSVASLMTLLGERSFGLTLLVLGVLSLPPALSYVTGPLIAWQGMQMILGYRATSPPRFLARREVDGATLARLLGLVVPWLAWVEPRIRARWPLLFATIERPTGGVMLVLGLSLVSPLPFSQVLPSLVVIFLALAWLERDGLALVAGFAAPAVSFAVTAATVWGAIQTIGWIDPLQR